MLKRRRKNGMLVTSAVSIVDRVAPTNAITVSELMSPKRKPTEQPDQKQTRLKTSTIFKNRDGLGAYIKNPESFPPSEVLYYNDDFVAVRDRYPKSSLH